MHKAIKAAAAGIAAAFISMSAVQAAEPLVEAKSIPGTFSANVGLFSEYFYRGISQTDDKPALQGGFDYSVKLDEKLGLGAYLGVWGSNVDFNEAAGVHGASVETDVYGGITGDVGSTGIGWDVGFIYYGYPGADSNLNYDFVEGKLALSYDFGFASATASVNYSNDFFAASGQAWYPKLAVKVPVGKYLTLNGLIAKQYIELNDRYGQPDYVEYGLGASVNLVGFDVSLNWTDTSNSACKDACGMVVLGVSRSF